MFTIGCPKSLRQAAGSASLRFRQRYKNSLIRELTLPIEREPNRRTIVANPNEPRAGENAYDLYNKAHPVLGTSKTIDRLKEGMKGLRGQQVAIQIHGMRQDSETGERKRFKTTRIITLNRYNDVFGPGSAYASSIHAMRERHSDDKLVVFSITIDPLDDEGDDE